MNNILNNKWIKAASVRAIKTFAQTFCSMITVGACISEIDWKYVLSVSVVSFVYSMATSVAGLPEVDNDGEDSEKE